LETTHFVHVAGTKGKGTTCLYCESIMTEYRKMANKSLKIGCLTSPHVTDIRERIRLNGSPISKQLFADHFFDVWGKMQQEPSGPSLPGFPGFLSLLGIYIFVKEMVDVAIVETGIGGENDSTNIISTPVATGITTIGLDHVKTLGDNLASIAWHKAGIFKKNSPAYTVEQDDTVLRMLQDRAHEKGTYGGLTVVPDGLAECYAVRVEPDMVFQQRNASLAIALADSCLKVLDPDAVMTPALASSIEKTELPGRSLVLRSESLEWYISSAHDELSIEVASSWYSNAVIQSEYV
jgi:folylpolyglutamate synthase